MNRLQTFIQAAKSPSGWAGAILLGAVLVVPTIPGPPDYSHEAAEYENLKALQDSEAGSARREAAAQALCREAHGEAVAMWTPEGHLVCRPRRGPAVAKVQVQL